MTTVESEYIDEPHVVIGFQEEMQGRDEDERPGFVINAEVLERLEEFVRKEGDSSD